MFAAKKRVQVQIPGFIFTVAPAEVKDEGVAAAVEAAVAAGATAVVLSDGDGRGLPSSTFWLNLRAFCRIGVHSRIV